MGMFFKNYTGFSKISTHLRCLPTLPLLISQKLSSILSASGIHYYNYPLLKLAENIV